MEPAPKVGPVGIRVAENVKALRGRVPVRELSAELGEAGRPMLPSAVTKIEQGARRVDVDDLVALAEVLDVSPFRLLADPDGVEIERFYELEEMGTLRPMLDAVRTLVDEEAIPLEDLIDYLRLAERMRAVFADVKRRKKG